MIAVVTVIEVFIQLLHFIGVIGLSVAPIVDFCDFDMLFYLRLRLRLVFCRRGSVDIYHDFFLESAIEN